MIGVGRRDRICLPPWAAASRLSKRDGMTIRHHGMPFSAFSPACSGGCESVQSKARLRLGQCLFQIADNILDILDADRQPHHLGTGARSNLLRVV